VAHEFEHRCLTEWICLEECGLEFSRREDFAAHILGDHLQNTNSALNIDDIVDSRELKRPYEPPRVIYCPFCTDPIQETKRLFQKHVGRHFDEIALKTLPLGVFGTEDNELDPLKTDDLASIDWSSKSSGSISSAESQRAAESADALGPSPEQSNNLLNGSILFKNLGEKEIDDLLALSRPDKAETLEIVAARDTVLDSIEDDESSSSTTVHSLMGKLEGSSQVEAISLDERKKNWSPRHSLRHNPNYPAVPLMTPLREYPGIDPLLGAFAAPPSPSPTPIVWDLWNNHRSRNTSQSIYIQKLVKEALNSHHILPDGIHRIIRVEIRYVRYILHTSAIAKTKKRPSISDLTRVSNQSIRDPDGIHISCKIWTAETAYLNKHLTAHFYVDEINSIVTHATYVVHDDR
jgi:hypothetical protein